MMIGAEKADSSLPNDLVIEILSRLPARSIARCRCVSKLWSTMLLCPYFNDLFRTRALARPPSLLFAYKRFDDWCFFTSPNPQNIDQKPCSLVADFRMKRPGVLGFHGNFIFFCPDVYELKICNPSTGQYSSLPLPESTRGMCWNSFIGFDPIAKQFKILFIHRSYPKEKEKAHQILTLGTGSDSWRRIHCPITHLPYSEGICIDGVLYYLATDLGVWPYIIVCFDVRSEKFKLIDRGFEYNVGITKLINYKGKLGAITLTAPIDGRFKLCMWVREDDEYPKSKWSERYSRYWDEEVIHKCNVSIAGLTAIGEIVLCTRDALKPFYVFYIDLERNTIQSVEIQGLRPNHFDNHGELGEYCYVEVFADYVEDLKFITMEVKTSNKPTRTEA